ncbi:MAG: hypothetical protein VX498_15210, partial [Myxococcota bacterium]|nr:hypothetical protein [Myxococcota bacterium]
MPRRIHLALAALAALAAVVACVEPEPEPIEPTQARIGNPLDASIESLVDGHVSFGDGLSDYSFLYSTEDGLFHQAPGEEDPRALGTEAGALSGATEFSDGSLLVAGSEGLFSIWSGTLLASPLQSTLAPLGAARVLATPGEGGDDLWLMAEEQTHIWSEGSLYTLSPGGLQFAARETAWGA